MKLIRLSIKKSFYHRIMTSEPPFWEKYVNIYEKEIVSEENDEETDVETIKSELLDKSPFVLPIEYHNPQCLSGTLRADIEFHGDNNLMSHILPSKCNHVPLLMEKWSSLYTTNKDYLKDNQGLLKSYHDKDSKMDEFIQSYLDFKSEQNFLGKFQYIQFRRFFFLNSIIGFLQFLALYNICSPLFSLLSPFMGLIVPYFMFYLKGIRMSFSSYLSMVKTMIMNLPMVRNLLQFNKGNIQHKIYTMVYLFFYVMSIYNNVNSCIHFYKNTNFMIEFNSKYFSFLSQGSELIQHMHDQTKTLPSFSGFNEDLLRYQKEVQKMQYSIVSLNNVQQQYMKYGQIGLLMKSNFDMFYDESHHNCVMYLTYLNQYHRNMMDLAALVKGKKLNPCTFLGGNKKPTKMKKMYYIAHPPKESVKNNISLDKNIIITGPNASGKTTLIKSVIINLFLSQSIGMGCYKKCKLHMYDYFHSYLNIPDTSNRDSLFQAEARRCKDIFEFIKAKKDKRHLCIFDEIYSGTNPQDAVLCADIYLKGMNQYKSCVDFVLTTHYLDLCKKFEEKDSVIKNQQMDVNQPSEDNIEYTYVLKNGISNVHGGYQVLKDLEYPEELMK